MLSTSQEYEYVLRLFLDLQSSLQSLYPAGFAVSYRRWFNILHVGFFSGLLVVAHAAIRFDIHLFRTSLAYLNETDTLLSQLFVTGGGDSFLVSLFLCHLWSEEDEKEDVAVNS